VGRPHLLKRYPLASLILLVPLVLVACGEPAGPAPGDVYRLDATARAVYDCAPGLAEPIDQAICGTRVDTVDLDHHGSLSGRLEITRVDSLGDRRRTGTGVRTGGTWPDALTMEGEVTEEVCAPECTTTVGTRRGYVGRSRASCTSARACDGHLGDTVVTVVVWIEDMHEIFGLLLGGTEIEVGRMEGEYVQFGQFVMPLGPPPRHGARYHLSLVRERHYLGG
jgi:hypothetical protein